MTVGGADTPDGPDGPDGGEPRDQDAPQRVRPVLAGRSAARERALHLLYEADMRDEGASEVLGAQVVAADAFAAALAEGVHDHGEEIDALIEDLAPDGWPLHRMATLDLLVMRLACFELAHRPDVPSGVVLSEAVDLAERYGSDESPRFVNGLLAAAAERLRPGD